MDYLDRIASIDNQIAAVTKMRQSGELPAAGLSLGLTIGPKDPEKNYTVELGLGLTTDVEGILDLVLKGLKDSRKFYVRQLTREHQRITAFLEKEHNNGK